MSEQAVMWAGPIGPDAISIPGESQRLRSAADGLERLCEQLESVAQQLKDADADEGRRGRTVRSLSRIAQQTGRVLTSDVERLRQVHGAVTQEADLLDEAQGGLQEARRRWRQARQDLRAALASGGGGGKGDGPAGAGGGQHRDAEAVIDRVDHNVAQQHEGPFQRLAGLAFTPAGGGRAEPHAMLVDHEADQAITAYRREVSGILEDLVESMRRVRRVDDDLAGLLPREDRAHLAAAPVDPQQGSPETAAISLPEDIRTVGQQIQDGARALEEVAGQLRDVRLSIREGRMLPESERIGSMEGFQRDWTAHLEELCEDLRHAKSAAGDIADQLAELDERGAQQVRRSLKEG